MPECWRIWLCLQALAAARENIAIGDALLPEAISIERDFAEFEALTEEVRVTIDLFIDLRIYVLIDSNIEICWI